jgi:hypothetical protein
MMVYLGVPRKGSGFTLIAFIKGVSTTLNHLLKRLSVSIPNAKPIFHRNDAFALSEGIICLRCHSEPSEESNLNPEIL